MPFFYFTKYTRESINYAQAQFDDLQEAHSNLRADSVAEIRRLRREAREVAKAAEEQSRQADEAMDQVHEHV